MQQTSSGGFKEQIWLGGEADPLGIVQEIEIWPYFQKIYVKTRIRFGKWDT